MKKISPLALAAILLLSLCAGAAAAHGPSEDISLTKKDSRTFETGPAPTLRLSNKYGEVIVHAWNEPRVKAEVEITAFGKDEREAERLLDRVSFDWALQNGEVRIQTLFDQHSSPIAEFWRSVTDEASALLSRSKVEIDYHLYVPPQTLLHLDNKYGDVYLEGVQGELHLTLAHGDFQADRLEAPAKLSLNFAKASIVRAGELELEIKGGHADIDTVQALNLNSAVSSIHIGAVDELRLHSRNDQIYIEEAGSLSGKALFSKIQTKKLRRAAVLDLSYGRLQLKEVELAFQEITLSSNSTDISIALARQSAFQLDVTALHERLRMPSSGLQVLSESVDAKGKFATTKASAGKQGQAQGKIAINAKGGEVSIDYLP